MRSGRVAVGAWSRAVRARAFSGTASKHISLYDTTLRDGTQGEGVSLSLHDKLASTRTGPQTADQPMVRLPPCTHKPAVRALVWTVAERLDDMKFDFIEGGYPLSNEKDVAFFEQVRSLGLRHATVCAFGMTRRRGVEAHEDPGMQALLRSEAAVCTVVGKTWDFHVAHVLRVSPEENVAMISDSLSCLVSNGRRVIYDVREQTPRDLATPPPPTGTSTTLSRDWHGISAAAR